MEVAEVAKKRDEILQFALQAPDIGCSALYRNNLGRWKRVAIVFCALLGWGVGKPPLATVNIDAGVVDKIDAFLF